MNINFWKYIKFFGVAILGGAALFVINSISKESGASNFTSSLFNEAHADVPLCIGSGAESGCDSGSESCD